MVIATTFRDSFALLHQEGYLIRTALAQGLTALRSANIGEKGQYYAAFFGLSIGLERLFKLILVLDHMARFELAAPTGSVLKNFGGSSGHDLLALFANARKIPVSASSHPLEVLEPPSLEHDIIVHLSGFAKACGRYANFEALATAKPLADPLADWKRIATVIFEQDVPSRAKQSARRDALALADAFDGVARVTALDLDKTELSLQGWFEIPRMHELAARQSVVRVMRILCGLKELLEEINHRAILENQRLFPNAAGVPFMYEFLDFVSPDERLTLRKKRWP